MKDRIHRAYLQILTEKQPRKLQAEKLVARFMETILAFDIESLWSIF